MRRDHGYIPCVNRHTFADALREQRAGGSQERLAELAGVPVERVVALEQGAAATTSEIARLAAALAVDPAALWRGEVAATRTTARFRSPYGVASLSEGDARILALAAEVGRIVWHLRSALGDPDPQVLAWRSVLAIGPWPEPWEQGYKLGARARMNFASAKKPIPSMQQMLEELGVHVAWSTFETKDVIAASLYEPGAAPVIVLNSASKRAKAPLSRRAVLAHELCHILHDGGETDLLTLVTRGSDNDATEQRANGFAPSFIVPGGWLLPDTTDPRDMAMSVGASWGLSFEGALWHLKNAGCISNGDAEELKSNPVPIPQRGFEAAVPRRLPAELGIDIEACPLAHGLLSDLALRACEEDLISKRRASEILGLG